MGDNLVNHQRALARVGERHGMLVLIEYLGSNAHRYALFKCRCDCGTECVKTSIGLKKPTPNCGCETRRQRAEHKKKHGGSTRTVTEPLYVVWSKMRQRCSNPNSKDYKWYGGKGIQVCDRWQAYANFREDMLPSYEPGLTIERIDSDRDYEPSNCEWITRSENTRRAMVKKAAKKIKLSELLNAKHAE